MTEYRVETVEMGSGYKSRGQGRLSRELSQRQPTRDGGSSRHASRGAVLLRVGPCTCS